MKLIILALVILFLVLQYQLWFAKGSILSAWNLQRDIKKQKVVNIKLNKRNERLKADINDLKNGKKAIEEHARNDLGMIKKNETFYQIVPEEKDHRS